MSKIKITQVNLGENTPDRPKHKGLGDIVHSIAHPIAKAIDTVAGTHITTCGACARRRKMLNEAFPLAKQPEKPSISPPP